MSNLRMVQEGDVIDLPNAALSATVAGALVYTAGYVGQWNEGGIAPGARAPLIARGVIQKRVAGGAGGIAIGDKLSLDTDTGELVKAPDGTMWDDDTVDGAGLISFGRSLTAIPANGAAKAWIRIKPQ